MSIESHNDAKAIFRQCGTCSQTFAHILNREFGRDHDAYEKALDPLAGGILRKGHQCGMLWGATLAVGAEAARRTDNPQEARIMAISAAQKVVESFVDRTNTVNCKEIT